MKMPKPSINLPEVPFGEASPFNTRDAPGLFAYRHIQAMELMNLPDYGSGDLDADRRSEALRCAVSLKRPLAAFALFLGVVALEDFIRDLAARLADNPSCLSHFPRLSELRAQPKKRSPYEAFKRLDTDPAGVLDPEDINKIFSKTIAVEPIPAAEFWHLRDLVLLRHTIAHHAAVIREVDRARFAHFIVTPGRVINPPPEFVQAELRYLYNIGRKFELSVQDAIFGKLITAAGRGWSDQVPSELVELIELFGFFGHIESTTVAFGSLDSGSDNRRRQEVEALRIRSKLLERCVADLKTKFGD